MQILRELGIFAVVHRTVDDAGDLLLKGILQDRQQFFRLLHAVAFGMHAFRIFHKIGILEIHNCFVDFQNPDFVKYAESMHAKGYRVEKAEELLPILEDAFQQKVPCIIDCPVDYSENTKLSEYLHDKFEK